MTEWEQGRGTVEYLIGTGRLESVAAEGNDESADLILGRAGRRLTTASAGLDGGDIDGAFVAAYDAYRMASESPLARQGLRATGGEGSHVTVEDAVSAQFAGDIEAFAKPTYECFRRTRPTAQYFDPEAPEITAEDAVVGDRDRQVSCGRRSTDQRERESGAVRSFLSSIGTSGRSLTVA